MHHGGTYFQKLSLSFKLTSVRCGGRRRRFVTRKNASSGPKHMRVPPQITDVAIRVACCTKKTFHFFGGARADAYNFINIEISKGFHFQLHEAQPNLKLCIALCTNRKSLAGVENIFFPGTTASHSANKYLNK